MRFLFLLNLLFALTACGTRPDHAQLQHDILTLSNGTEAQRYTLTNDFLSLSVIPALGGKIVSLQNAAGQEFISRSKKPYNARRYGASFKQTELDGIEECFPSIEKSIYPLIPWKDRLIPDHGEVYQLVWHLDAQNSNSITCSAQGKAFPYLFQRSISIKGNMVHLDYEIRNISAHTLHANYAFKPHFQFANARGIELHDDTLITALDSSDHFIGEENTQAPWGSYLDKNGVLLKDQQQINDQQYYSYHSNKLQTGHYRIRYDNDWALNIQWPSQLFPYLLVHAQRNDEDQIHSLCPMLSNTTHLTLQGAYNHKEQLKISSNAVFNWRISISLEEPVPSDNKQ